MKSAENRRLRRLKDSAADNEMEIATKMLRRTKIIATLGPATDDESTIEGLIRDGIDLVILPFQLSVDIAGAGP